MNYTRPTNTFEHQVKVRGSKTTQIPFNHTVYEGLILPPMIDVDLLADLQENFEARAGDVFLVTYPKSGTFWLAQIARQILKPSPPLVAVAGGDIPYYELTPRSFLNDLPSPRCLFTHLPHGMLPRREGVRYVYLARNPRDVLVSYFHFSRLFKPMDWDGSWDVFLDHFLRGEIPYGSYYDHVLEWWDHRDDSDVYFLTYEELQQDLSRQINLIAEFLGVDLTDEELSRATKSSSFEAMKQHPETTLEQHAPLIFKKDRGSHLRKGIVGDWMAHFTTEQLDRFHTYHLRRTKDTGLSFKFRL